MARKRRDMTRFRAARTFAKLTQTEVSRLTGVAQGVISDLETGRHRNPTWEVLSKLSQVYDRRPEDLIRHVPLPVVTAGEQHEGRHAVLRIEPTAAAPAAVDPW